MGCAKIVQSVGLGFDFVGVVLIALSVQFDSNPLHGTLNKEGRVEPFLVMKVKRPSLLWCGWILIGIGFLIQVLAIWL